jgi:Tol biopolymer transport system component
MSADGTGEQQITNDPAEERYPDWSPDGQNLVFFSDKTGRHELYIVSKTDGHWGQPRQITTEGGVWPRWSPDGRYIAYNIYPLSSLAVMSADGRDRRVLVPSQPSRLPQDAAWSDDSKTLYVRAADEQNRGSLWAVPLNGGSPQLKVKFDDPLRPFLRIEFATSRNELFFTITERQANIWLLQLR